MISLTKTATTAASNTEGEVIVLPVGDLPAGFWSTDPAEFNVHRVAPTGYGTVELYGDLIGFGPESRTTVTLAAGRALELAA